MPDIVLSPPPWPSEAQSEWGWQHSGRPGAGRQSGVLISAAALCWLQALPERQAGNLASDMRHLMRWTNFSANREKRVVGIQFKAGGYWHIWMQLLNLVLRVWARSICSIRVGRGEHPERERIVLFCFFKSANAGHYGRVIICCLK